MSSISLFYATKEAIKKYLFRLQNMQIALDMSLRENVEDAEKILAEFCKTFRHPYSSSPCFKCPLVEVCPFPEKRKV
jgi:CRISPR/Cas system-associated exonuclease Cas4 (RecB family)